MGIQIQGNGGVIVGAGAEAFAGLHTRIVPLSHGAFGHYRANHFCNLVNAQAANSWLFSLRNTGANIIVITRLVVKWMTASAHTAIIHDSLDFFKLTAFTTTPTTNTVTPVASRKRSTMAAAPGNVDIRGLTVAGNSAGMTGFVATKDGGSAGQVPMTLPVAVMAATETLPRVWPSVDLVDDINGTHPWVFANNEGFEIENRVLLGAAAGSTVYFDLSYAELAATGF